MTQERAKRILIAEDDNDIAELERDYLAASGFESVICSNGAKIFSLIKSGEFDLILLDLMLPGINGLDILRHVRDELDIPVIIVSAKKDEADKIKGLNLGADDYIAKPFSPGELVARVKSNLSNYNRIRARISENNNGRIDPFSRPVISVRGIEIDRSSRRVTVNGKEINLTLKEYELLLFLISNPDRVFDREELFSHVWGADALGDSATVTVHIGRIREKIEIDLSSSQYIETVWGVGYRFRV
ncbi:MAG: response regulator transcription factor [Eubacteriales bacterium]|nr:response regulator transcription factor [Eubacteriales bacterium]